MSILKQLAGRTNYNINNPNDTKARKENTLLDPASISLIISLISTLVKAIKACRKEPSDVIDVAYKIKEPQTKQEYRQMKRIVRREMGWWNYWTKGTKTMDGIIETAKYSSEEEIDAVFKEVSYTPTRK